MKVRIFNRGRGWYVSGSNYKDTEDKAYMNVGFTRGTEPPYVPAADNPFIFRDIDIEEAKFNSYQKQIGMFVFKYKLIPAEGELTEVERENKEFAEAIKDTPYAKNFGGSQNVDISPDDLPFY